MEEEGEEDEPLELLLVGPEEAGEQGNALTSEELGASPNLFFQHPQFKLKVVWLVSLSIGMRMMVLMMTMNC